VAAPAEVAQDLRADRVAEAIVEQQEVRTPPLRELERLRRGGGFACEAELRPLQREPDPAAHHRVVLDQEDGDFAHTATRAARTAGATT